MSDKLKIGDKFFDSRLILGTGKYASFEQTQQAVEASAAEIITVAIARTNLGQQPNEKNLLDYLSPDKYTILPNTAGCFDIDTVLKVLSLARELLNGANLVKLELLADKKTLYPKVVESLKAAEKLIKDGFEVMAYTTDDPVIASELASMGVVAVMPLAAPIGSGLGICNPYNLALLKEQVDEICKKEGKHTALIVDAGIGRASDAVIAMELGYDAVLVNSAVAYAQDPIKMAQAMQNALIAGRKSYLAKPMKKKLYATASSPIDNIFGN